MKFLHLLPLAAATSALVLPQEEVFEDVSIENHHRDWVDEVVAEKDHVVSEASSMFEKYFQGAKDKTQDAWASITETSSNALDAAFDQANDASETAQSKVYDAASGVQSWVDSALEDARETFDEGHHRPHHPPHHGKPNMTVYQLISESKYTTKLAKAISEFDDLVEALNSTISNYTVFAPTDKAFDKIPMHGEKPSKEMIKAFLSYHVVPDFAPAVKVLSTHTFPTLLKSDHLGSEPLPQRLTPRISLRGLTINFYSRIVAINIFGTNGVIHGIDTPLFPPPGAIRTIDFVPEDFSTLELGLIKTGLLEKLNTTDHAGGTFFAPSNFAFKKLGPKVNAFLFSQYGLKYLKALLEYHVVPENTLYSDAYYKADSSNIEPSGKNGYFHVDLPTLLKDRSLAVDIARYGGFISIKVNAFATVSVQDVVAEDGVIQVMGDVLVPPKKLGGEAQYWQGEEMSVEDLKERLEPFVAKSDL
ncbi:uncharacterized protein LTR77_000139 [Saxophila tyrrhenica]|uniref:FAS1 domain-containing protein n=1 Tax=Saxophila tyrrhenica TaxID=1690608 RepID=A0AAV9PRL4_9PEZI|nr:hypothetical protein LTR77_000139 [Saxophila tyrrhenica]